MKLIKFTITFISIFLTVILLGTTVFAEGDFISKTAYSHTSQKIAQHTVLLAQNEEIPPEELNAGFPIWSIILIIAGVVLVILLILIFTAEKK